MATLSALLVDDEAIVRQGLGDLLSSTGWVSVADTADSASTAQQALERSVPDLVVTDLVLGDGPDGIQLTKAIKARHPHLPVLLLSGYDESLFAEQAIEAGAAGFVMKDAPVERLLTAIRTAVDGGIWVSEEIQEDLMGVTADATELRHALGEALYHQLRSGNRSVLGLAQALEQSLREVEAALDRACRSLGVPSRVALFLLVSRDPSIVEES